MPYAFVNGLLRVARATDSGEGDGEVSPYVSAVRDALRVGGCTASRAGLVGACVAAASVSLGWSQGEGSTLGGVPLAWVERVWCGQRVLELLPELGGHDRLQTPCSPGCALTPAALCSGRARAKISGAAPSNARM